MMNYKLENTLQILFIFVGWRLENPSAFSITEGLIQGQALSQHIDPILMWETTIYSVIRVTLKLEKYYFYFIDCLTVLSCCKYHLHRME